MIEVTVRLDESAIQTAAEDAWKRLLAPDDYRGHGGGAYHAVEVFGADSTPQAKEQA